MKIKFVQPDSIGDNLDIRAGDDLVSINGKPIVDEIDYRFYVSDEHVELLVRRNKQDILFDIKKDIDDLLGIQLENFRTKTCGNACVFCFTDQNPPGMRSSLYFKDEDYRMSFLYGHYTTLTNTKQTDLERIVEQRLSPLYISVHSTDWQIRKYLFALKRPDNLMEKILFLIKNRIQLHIQIVLCPGINDKEHLKKTIDDLAGCYPRICSVAVVPVGLTRHREGLEKIKPVTSGDALHLLDQLTKLQSFFKNKFGTGFVFPGDEFFISAGQEIPGSEYYEDYPQVEDGVGMVRFLIDSIREVSEQLVGEQLPGEIKPERTYTILSGVSAATFLEAEIIPVLNVVKGLKFEALTVKNRFYGESITVSGLLTGQDFAQAIISNRIKNKVLIPSKCLNQDGLFLDNWDLKKLEQTANCSVLLIDDFMADLPEVLEEQAIGL